eukprot:6492164-Amphidinium_carterae.1
MASATSSPCGALDRGLGSPPLETLPPPLADRTSCSSAIGSSPMGGGLEAAPYEQQCSTERAAAATQTTNEQKSRMVQVGLGKQAWTIDLCTLHGLTPAGVARHLCAGLSVCGESVSSSTTIPDSKPTGRNADLLPFPLLNPTICANFQTEFKLEPCLFEQAWSWLCLVVRALNSTLGETEVPLTKVQLVALQKLLEQCVNFCRRNSSSISINGWRTVLSARSLSYTGEERHKAVPLSWLRVERSLPDVRFCASLCAVSMSAGPVRHYLEHPELAMENLDHVMVRPKPGRVHVVPGDLLPLARGLLERGLVEPIEEHDLTRVGSNSLPLLNGLFGVPKAGSEFDPNGPLRLIMNLTASNECMHDFQADVHKLPSMHTWRAIALSPGEKLTLNWDDLKAAFYVFRLPSGWRRCFAFDAKFTSTSLSLPGPHRSIYLGAVVVPMG